MNDVFVFRNGLVSKRSNNRSDMYLCKFLDTSSVDPELFIISIAGFHNFLICTVAERGKYLVHSKALVEPEKMRYYSSKSCSSTYPKLSCQFKKCGGSYTRTVQEIF